MTLYDIPTTWHSLESARDEWEDAPLNDERLASLLEAARGRVVRWAGWQPGATNVPSNFREGQLRVAINLWNSERDSEASSDGEFQFTPRMLEWKTLVPRGRAHVR